jgi:hypothetical protein
VKTLTVPLLLAALFAGFAPGSLRAQGYTLTWYKIAGGGGTATGSVYSASGTVGQHDAGGPFTGNGYSVTSGFWAVIATQTAGAPTLSIFATGTNSVVISWPASSTGFVLQQNPDLTTTNWVAATNTVTVTNGQNQVTVFPPTGNRYFRLQHP